MKEKLNAKVLFDDDSWTRFQSEVPKMKVITPSGLVKRLKINGSLARAACRALCEEGKIAAVSVHSKQLIYTRIAQE